MPNAKTLLHEASKHDYFIRKVEYKAAADIAIDRNLPEKVFKEIENVSEKTQNENEDSANPKESTGDQNSEKTGTESADRPKEHSFDFWNPENIVSDQNSGKTDSKKDEVQPKEYLSDSLAILYTKLKKWEYENEYRLIRFEEIKCPEEKEEDPDRKENPNLIPAEICAVYFGPDCPEDHQRIVLKLLGERVLPRKKGTRQRFSFTG